MSNRRDFLKKGLLGGIGFGLLGPFRSIADENDLKLEKLKRSDSSSNKPDWAKIRSQFTYRSENAYLNTASLSLTSRLVAEGVYKSMMDLGELGRDGRWYFKDCRKKIAQLLKAKEEEIAITRNATEGMNIIARSIDLKSGDEIILSKHEHVGGASPWLMLKNELGIKIKTVELDLNGEKNIELLEKAISSKTKVISVSHILCTTGMVLPAKEIVELCRSKGIISCIDGAQAVGAIPVDLSLINPDFYAASGHKWLFGPKGTGILFINSSILPSLKVVFAGAYTDSEFDLNQQILEYRNVAERTEYGTRNASIVKGLEVAVDLVSTIGVKNILERGRELSDRLRNGLTEFPTIEMLTPSDHQYSASILTFKFKDRTNKEIVAKLRSEHQLVIRHIYENDLDAIRVSPAIYNSEEDVDALLFALKSI